MKVNGQRTKERGLESSIIRMGINTKVKRFTY